MIEDSFEDYINLNDEELYEAILKIKSKSLSVLNSLKKLEVFKGFRKPSIGFYDHALHLVGGGQKYGLLFLDTVKELFDITLITNKKIDIKTLEDWYGVSFPEFKIKTIELDFFKEDEFIDPNKVLETDENPFFPVIEDSINYDIFINNSMNEMVYPLSPLKIAICHFPERRPERYFYFHLYDYIIYNSKYTAFWIEKRWGIKPNFHIYPPIDVKVNENRENKEDIILSIARFEIGGTKRQLEMVKTFIYMKRFLKKLESWKLILIGGSSERDEYLKKVKDIASECKDIEIKVNVSGKEIFNYLERAKIFWHLCGLYSEDPSEVEHFGMGIVEAMLNGAVPIVFDGGGQREIVDDGVSGYRVSSIVELAKRTVELVEDEEKMAKLSLSAVEKGKSFLVSNFRERVFDFFKMIFFEEFKKEFVSFKDGV